MPRWLNLFFATLTVVVVLFLVVVALLAPRLPGETKHVTYDPLAICQRGGGDVSDCLDQLDDANQSDSPDEEDCPFPAFAC